ncbi:MAG TPA: amino acid adenylation domain-containing protein [Vicinamibacterales bacterium]
MSASDARSAAAAARPETVPPSTLVDVLRERARVLGRAAAFVRWADKARDERSISYAELDYQARAIAASLQARGLTGERVMLLLQPGLSYIAAFFGCLYAGAVAVPCYPPGPADGSGRSALRRSRSTARVETIARAAAARAAILPGGSDQPAFAAAGGAHIECLGVDQLLRDGAPLAWSLPELSASSIALLQFTSGSTGTPRGVVLTHDHLIANSQYIREAFDQGDGGTVVSWLPPYHDMGLIGGILQPIYSSGRCVVLTPSEFLQRPRRWLEAIDRYRADTSGGPNFAYDLCTRRIPIDQRAGLALTSWRIAFTGAEPIRAGTLQRFSEAYAPQGFRSESLFPCYGLAEATLAVTGNWAERGPRIVDFDRAALEERRAIPVRPDQPAKRLVSSGRAVGSLRLAVVDSERGTELPPGHVGEVWVHGRSIASGYWQDPIASANTFDARLSSGAGPFLRTGDLGFVDADGHLFISGRIRDVIIIRGRNHHPADIEATVEACHMVIRSGGCAAFGIPADDEETLAVVAELDPRSGATRDGHHDPAALQAVANVVRAAVLGEHGVEPSAVLLAVAGAVPRTTSGKVQRYACRAGFLGGTLPTLYQWRRDHAAVVPAAAVRRPPRTPVEREVAAIWASVLNVEEPALEDDFFEAGGHSLLALELVERLTRHLGIEVALQTLIDHPTIEQLAGFVAGLPRDASEQRTISLQADSRFEPFPLTDVQEAYLFGRSSTFELGGVATQGVAEFETRDLDIGRLQNALDRLIAHHDMLRAVIGADGHQRVLHDVPSFPIEILDLSGRVADDQERHLERVRVRLNGSTLAADRWPLFEIVICKMDDRRSRLFARFDLLIADLYSLRLLWRQLGELYLDPTAFLSVPALSFRDCVRQAASREGADWERSAQFWRERVPLLPPAPELPYVTPFRAIATPRFRRRSTTLDATTWSRLQQRARRSRVTAPTLLLAAYADVLAAWSRQSQFTLTLTYFNRPPLPDVERLVGDFTSLLLVDVNAASGDFDTLLRAVQRRVWEALAHRSAGGMRTIREFAKVQRRAAHAVAPVVFTCAIGQEKGVSASPWAWTGELVGGVSSTPQVTLDHQVQEDGDQLLLTWDAVEDLFPPGVLDDMFQAYIERLRWLADEGLSSSTSAPALTPATQLARVAQANRTDAPLRPATLHGLFLQQAAAAPNRVAVVDAADRRVTYAELERRSRAVACWIQQHGVDSDELVAVVMKKGWEQIVATLGILRAGGTYLPVDPALPEQRRHHLFERGRVRLALTQPALDNSLSWPRDIARLTVDGAMPTDDDAHSADPDDWTRAAYVIFTSGSTGEPKGVTIDHRGAVNTIVDLNQRFGIGANDRVLALSGLGFDLSVYDIFGMLAAGGGIVLPAPGSERNPEHWLELGAKHGVTLWNSVPALFEMACDYAAGSGMALPPSLRVAWLSGDWIPVSLPDRARALRPGLDVISMGGATEASIWSVIYPIGPVDPFWRSIPYGRPMVNQRMHVFDHQMRPRPDWVAGDLYIGGVGVAQGYWRDAEKTARAFIYHPGTHERLYRTGDIARWRPDGHLEFLGRDDGQVKIGGLRIELGEIEAAINGHPAVRQAVVVARHLEAAGGGDASAASRRQLVAFVVPTERGGSIDDLPEWLAARLPAGLIPRRFVTVSSLPLSANGKVDTAQLFVPTAASDSQVSLDENQTLVRDIWADAIGIVAGSIGLHVNFFDIGGSSVTLVRVAGAVSAHAGRNIPLLTFFSEPTVAEMAQLIAGTPTAAVPPPVEDRAARRKQHTTALRARRNNAPAGDDAR